jgi:homoserine kinase type II
MAVYTHIDETELRALLADFDLGALLTWTGIAEGVENTNYAVETEKGRYVLTLVEKRASASELPFHTGFMDHLRARGIPCAAVLAGRDGQKIFAFKGKPALLTEFLPGAWPREITVPQCRAVGGLTGQMHRAGRDFPMKRKNQLSLQAWRGLIHACGSRADEIERGLFAFLEVELNFLEAHWPKYLPRGAVHADLFPDNVFFDGEKVSGVIDFYFSCTEALAYDLMLTLNPWCFDWKGELDVEKSRALLEAYHRARPLTKNEIKSLPFFGRAAAMRIIATRLYDWLHPVEGAMVRAKDPLEHVKILRFHQRAASVADYGFEIRT